MLLSLQQPKMFLYIACVLCIVAYAVIKYCNHQQKYADFYKIKGPKPQPIVGNAMLFGSTPREGFQAQLNLAEQYGDMFRLVMGWHKTVVLYNANHVEKILNSTKHTKKSFQYKMLKNCLEGGLFTSEGEYWKRHRKIITPTFHFKSLQDYAISILKNLQILIKILDGKTTTIIDIYKFVHLYTMDTFCDSAMHYNSNTQLRKESAFLNAQEGWLKIMMQRFFSPFLRYDCIFNLSQYGKLEKSYVEVMQSLTNTIIAKRKAERVMLLDHNAENMQRSFLDLLLDKQQEGNPLTDDEIRGEVAAFLFGGHHTVASSITFCLYELAAHPELQEELVQESYKFMPADKEVEVNGGNIASLKRLDCVVKECMRIYTTVPFIERELAEDVVLDGLRIPAGTTILILIYMLHRNVKYYPEPEKFDPERFNTENCKTRPPFAYIPFSAGPRNCLGFKYGMLMTKASVVNILRHFKVFRPDDPKYNPQISSRLVLGSTNGVHLRLEPRN